MNSDYRLDQITIEDEDGETKEYNVEALFEMEDQSYALLSAGGELLVMRIEEYEDEQTLVGITDRDEKEAILSAYTLAMEAVDETDTRFH